ncbi:IQ and ubiquitin-like domain-containing protein [Trichosurus vulpecula]|uniref:IQ and ubiquitin-like domain-containing protein n=1 Tax=Trichosurus vulpecula TaxID=9337 RepID=UPI00186AF68D|nr:IQ and ubiquitin-like domain-containing protein [Trichosurus vulpecula]
MDQGEEINDEGGKELADTGETEATETVDDVTEEHPGETTGQTTRMTAGVSTEGTQLDSKEQEGWEEQEYGRGTKEESMEREKSPSRDPETPDTKAKKVRLWGSAQGTQDGLPGKRGKRRLTKEGAPVEPPARTFEGLLSQVPVPESYLTKIKAIKEALKTTVADFTATVKVMLIPVDQIVTFNFKIGVLLKQLKAHFSELLQIPSRTIQLTYRGRVLKDSETLMHLGVKPEDTVNLELVSLNPTRYPIKPVFRKIHGVHDVITVRVQTGAKVYQDITVEIERIDFHKPFLGGFRHKITGTEYHNAGTQTVPKKAPVKMNIFSRDTQTVTERKKLIATTSRTSTQMTKIGVYVSNMTDKLITPGKYFTAAQYHARRLAAVIVIQKYYRRWHAKKLVERLREQKRKRLEWEIQEKIRKEKEKREWLQRDYERRINPQTNDDFELLFHALEVWRQEQLKHIDDNFTGAKRKAALCELLEKETQIIASIGRQRIRANNQKYEKSIFSFLDKCSAPKMWVSFDNKETLMDTQYTIRARELQDIYNCIIIKNICDDERLDVLLTLKHTVKEHECKLTQDILELIDREVDLMMRGVKRCNLEGLRKRIATLFLQYIKTPLFNPEVARYLKVPQDPTKFYKNIYFCRSCEMYLPSTEFSISSTSYHVSRCRQCCMLDNEARQREAFLKYKVLLKQLYQSEADYEDDSKIAYLMQLQDLQYLIENVWASQSVLSAWDDLYDLVIVRWNKTQEWAPWNCILLTKDEADAHLKMKSLEEGYEPVFIHRIKHKHILAKNYFSQIPMMAAFLQCDDTEDEAKEEESNAPKEKESNQTEEEKDKETRLSIMPTPILEDTEA